MAEVVFDVAEFRDLFPAFSDETKFSDTRLRFGFTQAVDMIGATDETSLIPYNPDAKPAELQRKTALLYLTCHILTMLYLWEDDQSGAVKSASQGSVSVSFGDMSSQGSPEWWNATKCGATAWQIISSYASTPVYFGVRTIVQGG